MTQYQYYKKRLAPYSFPYACLDMSLFYQNIQDNMIRAGNKNIRIASKSIRCTEVMRSILEYDDQFQGIMTYHGREAVYLASQGFDNLLMAYPVVDEQLLVELADAIIQGTYICLMADSEEHLMRINKAGKQVGVRIPVCLDIDLSDDYPGLHFGVWRSKIKGSQDLRPMIDLLKRLNHIQLDGIMGYEAQVAGVTDQVKGGGLKNQVVRLLKRRSIPRIRRHRKEVVEALQSAGFSLKIVNGGGTGSLESTHEEAVVTEVTVGSGFYNSHLFDDYQHFSLQPALFYGVEIVRIPAPGVYTCHGGGFIASGKTDSSKSPIVHLPQSGYLDGQEGAGEVQTPIRFKNLQESLELGDPIFMRHAKAGELCERFNQIILLEESGEREVLTYRGEGMSFG